MMPVIRISDAAFTNLKHIATWLEADTPSQTIDRLVQNEMERLGLERDGESEAENGAGEDILIFEKAPGLSFTRILSAAIDNGPPIKTNWAGLLLEVVRKVHAKGITKERLIRELQVPAKVSKYEQHGFKYYPSLGISIQGQSASDVWKEVDRLAKKHGIPVDLEFQWRDNEKAQHPNRTARIRAGL